MARRLQAEMNAEDSQLTSPHSDPKSPLSAGSASETAEDEALARQLQAEFDHEVRAATAAPAVSSPTQVRELEFLQRTSPTQAASAAVVKARSLNSPVKGTLSQQKLNAAGNLLAEPVAQMHGQDIWTARQKKL